MTEMTTLYQYNTLGALMAGLYKGTMTIGELLKHGDMGIGTVDSIDGELIILDGKAYQAKGDKTITELSDDVTVPYAAVVNHRADHRFNQTEKLSADALKAKMEEHFGENLFQSIKITGSFSKMHVRMIPRAEEGVAFVEVASNQPEYIEENVTGTIVGVWTPELFHGVSVAGYHLHFLSDDHVFGGHVLDFELESGEVEIGRVDELQQGFPVNNENFLKAKFNVNELKAAIDTAE
ncbi:acetolactate decarboxylase [Lactococcus termiticola]|uniref:Alpha-acetolactate decarboxylase n=1 Tax=Lactococcus termiticola TaxID=2169526 RepID=A0A2R5HK91_9LACT|nr:acetolactate decarboxylase [Lactococcus termiticola]GBG97210.1 alpha-acetolactate decarboxylase [Lactococcus termiticola]